MTEYHNVRLRLSDCPLDKLKSTIQHVIWVTLPLLSDMICSVKVILIYY